MQGRSSLAKCQSPVFLASNWLIIIFVMLDSAYLGSWITDWVASLVRHMVRLFWQGVVKIFYQHATASLATSCLFAQLEKLCSHTSRLFFQLSCHSHSQMFSKLLFDAIEPVVI
jgi:hypothetical protein